MDATGALMREEIGPPQVSVSSNPSPQRQQHQQQQQQQQRVMQNGGMMNAHAPPSNSHPAPIRSLAGIRQAMQQQRQAQVQHNMYLTNQGGGYPGMGAFPGAPSSMDGRELLAILIDPMLIRMNMNLTRFQLL